MASICAAAQMSPGAVYRYFRSKDALIAAIIEEHAQVAIGATAGRGLVALSAYAQALLCTDGDIRLATEVLSEAARRPELARCIATARINSQKFLAQLIAEGQARGEFAAQMDPRTAAAGLLCMLDGLFWRFAWSAKSPRLNGREAVAIFDASARAMLGVSAPRISRPRVVSRRTAQIAAEAV
jgi:AcrR family transcriptional regulator